MSVRFTCLLVLSMLANTRSGWAQALASSPAPTIAENILTNYEVIPNITYLVANNTELKLDVYRRKGSVPTPTVIYIHGGGWVAGDKESESLQALPYMEMGFSVVNVEYRLAHSSLAPAAVEDCRCALKWVIRNAAKHHFDPNKIILTGQSAGGHLALITGMLPASAGFDRECPDEKVLWTAADKSEPKVAAIVNWFGISDVAELLDGPNTKAYAVEWLAHLPQREQLAASVSPINYVRSGTPPIISIHGDRDEAVPYPQSVRLHDALKKAGVTSQLVTIPGGGHGGFTKEQLSTSFGAIRKFLSAQNLLPSPVGTH